MSSGASGEVVHCPNCKEDVPKTLYCLNCGFPLYKEEQVKEEKPAQEVTAAKQEEKAEPVAPSDDAVIMVDDEPEETPEKKIEVPPMKALEPAPVEEPPKVEPPTPEVEPVEPPTIVEVKNVEPSVEVKEEPLKMQEVAAPVVEAPPPPVVEPTPTAPSEPLSTPETASSVEAVGMVESYQEEAVKEYVPDPLSKDLMENLAKNISLRLKLVKLYREGVMKEETFTKLFDEYLADGSVWATRRDEMLTKLSAEVEEMEDAYVNATSALELLEIKKSIGDVSEDEYTAKAPAYRWDIDHFDFMVAEKRNKIAYLENVGVALPTGELKELRELASLQYNTVDALQMTSEEGLARVKQSLYDAIKTLG